MIVVYGYKNVFHREGNVGQAICQNCGHEAAQTLCRQVNQTTIFWIPIVRIEKQRGIMCECCGNIIPMSKQDYKQRKQNLKMI